MEVRNGTLRLLLALAPLVSFGVVGCSHGTTGPPRTKPAAPVAPILILDDGSTADSVLAILMRAGISVERGPDYWEFDGSGLDSVSAVIFLAGYDYYEVMPDSVQQKLMGFVAAGGGLMTTEWMLYESAGGENFYADVASIVPAVYAGQYGSGTETYTRVAPATSDLVQGLPASFAVGNVDWDFSYTTADSTVGKHATVIFHGSKSGDAVVVGQWGQGRTAHWNMTGQYDGADVWSPEVEQLLVNIARYISGQA